MSVTNEKFDKQMTDQDVKMMWDSLPRELPQWSSLQAELAQLAVLPAPSRNTFFRATEVEEMDESKKALNESQRSLIESKRSLDASMRYWLGPVTSQGLWLCPECKILKENIHPNTWQVLHLLFYVPVDNKGQSPAATAEVTQRVTKSIEWWKSKFGKTVISDQFPELQKQQFEVAYFGNLPTDSHCQNEVGFGEDGKMYQRRAKCGYAVPYIAPNLADLSYLTKRPPTIIRAFQAYGNYYWPCLGCSILLEDLKKDVKEVVLMRQYVHHAHSRYVVSDWLTAHPRVFWLNANAFGSTCTNKKFGGGPKDPNISCGFKRASFCPFEEDKDQWGCSVAVRTLDPYAYETTLVALNDFGNTGIHAHRPEVIIHPDDPER